MDLHATRLCVGANECRVAGAKGFSEVLSRPGSRVLDDWVRCFVFEVVGWAQETDDRKIAIMDGALAL
jgi:hypothetical protein